MKIFPTNNVYNKNFTVFAHRGVPKLFPENTLDSFKKAIELDYDGIELDVMLTSDDKLIVLHDQEIMEGSQKKQIIALQYKRICKILKNTPPQLEEILSSIGHQININIEIKDQRQGHIKIVEKIIRCLKKHNLTDNIVISSFNPQFIKYVKKVDDRLATAWIWGNKNLFFFNHWRPVLKYLKPQAIHIKHSLVNQRIIQKIKNQKIKVLAYTVNQDTILFDMILKKVDGIFTDDPAILLQSRNQDL